MPLQKEIMQRLQPTGFNSRFDHANLNFSAYISTTLHMLERVNRDYELGLTDTQLEYNAPFEIKPEQPNGKGLLLIHGLFDSPFIMRDVGQYYAKQGYLVRGILLPGHGTIPADLLTTSPQEWLKVTDYGVQSFINKVDELYIAGFSTGAMLALNHVLRQPYDIDIKGLILLSPCFAINTSKSILVRIYRMFRWMFREQKWVFRHECPDYTKYTSFPVNSGYLVQRIIIETKLLLQKQTCPVPIFMAISQDDETVRAEAAVKFFRNTENPKNRLLYYTNDTQYLTDSRMLLQPSAKPDEHIVDMSHVAVPVSPDNPHYGRHGDHKEPLREPKYIQDSEIHLGAATPENEEKYRLRRLTYNPFFADMLKEMDAFIAKTQTN